MKIGKRTFLKGTLATAAVLALPMQILHAKPAPAWEYEAAPRAFQYVLLSGSTYGAVNDQLISYANWTTSQGHDICLLGDEELSRAMETECTGPDLLKDARRSHHTGTGKWSNPEFRFWASYIRGDPSVVMMQSLDDRASMLPFRANLEDFPIHALQAGHTAVVGVISQTPGEAIRRMVDVVKASTQPYLYSKYDLPSFRLYHEGVDYSPSLRETLATVIRY